MNAAQRFSWLAVAAVFAAGLAALVAAAFAGDEPQRPMPGIYIALADGFDADDGRGLVIFGPAPGDEHRVGYGLLLPRWSPDGSRLAALGIEIDADGEFTEFRLHVFQAPNWEHRSVALGARTSPLIG